MSLAKIINHLDENGNVVIWEAGTSLVATDTWLGDLRQYLLPNGLKVVLFDDEVSK